MENINENKFDFDIDSIEKTSIELLNCQIDLILRSLEFYCYTYQYVYPRRNKSKTDEENLRISLVHDTYHQIAHQIKNDKSKELMNYTVIEDIFERIS